MKADVTYNDLIGTAAADISDHIAQTFGRDDLSSIAKHFGLDEERFNLIGLSLYGVNADSISFLCVDREKSTEDKEHIVTMMYDLHLDRELLPDIFKRLHIVLYEKFDERYPALDFKDEVRFSDYHNEEGN